MAFVIFLLLKTSCVFAEDTHNSPDLHLLRNYLMERYKGFLDYQEAKKREKGIDQKDIEVMREIRNKYENEEDAVRVDYVKHREPKPPPIDEEQLIAKANAEWVKEREIARKQYVIDKKNLTKEAETKFKVPENKDVGLEDYKKE